MIAINEINIGVTRRAKQDGGARRVSRGRVRRGIVFPEVSFSLNDPAGQIFRRRPPHQHLA